MILFFFKREDSVITQIGMQSKQLKLNLENEASCKNLPIISCWRWADGLGNDTQDSSYWLVS